MPDPSRELAGVLDRRSLVLFIGADLPRQVTDLPSRADLARALAHRRGLDESLPLAEVAQRVSQAGNRWEFTAFLRDALDTTGKSPQPFHRRVVARVQEYGIETLVTTAYDNLLELAFQEAGIPINALVRSSDVSFIAPDRPTLIKLYGDVQQPDTLVVTADDHYGLWRDRAKEDLLHEVRTVLRRQTVLFLGYNLADPDFNLLWREVLDRAGRFARTAYAVWPGLPESEVRVWRDRGIVILEADPLGVLTAFEGPSAPAGDREPTVGVPPLERSMKGEDMDYELGFQMLKACLTEVGAELLPDVATLEERFWKNQRAERLFGSSENTRNERSQIIFSLNELALKHCGVSFNDLCMGKQPQRQSATSDEEIIERLHRIEEKLDQGRAEERQAADQILDAIARDQVGHAEITQMVTELRDWAQTVQAAGLPLNPELRAALEALSEHEASAYQYLQLALPIIPGILSYNVELGSEHQLDLKALWDRLKARVWKRGPKGDGAALAPAKPILNTGKAWAVLVGINHYQDPYIANLQVCVDDVTAIHRSLDASYQVTKLLTDATPERLPTRANILGELSIMSQSATEGDLLLFYFSGHGIAEAGESYLLARDTRFSALKHTAVSMRDVRELMEQSPARAKVIILDACHAGASIGKTEPVMTPEFIQRVFEEAEGMAVLASCKQGQQSWEWPEEGRSAFTYYLLEALAGQADLDEKGFVSVSDASRYVTDGVKSWAAHRGVPQTPTLQYTVSGDIVLVEYP